MYVAKFFLFFFLLLLLEFYLKDTYIDFSNRFGFQDFKFFIFFPIYWSRDQVWHIFPASCGFFSFHFHSGSKSLDNALISTQLLLLTCNEYTFFFQSEEGNNFTPMAFQPGHICCLDVIGDAKKNYAVWQQFGAGAI